MLERPPGGTTMRLPAGLMGMSSGVGGPAKREKDEIKRPKISVGGWGQKSRVKEYKRKTSAGFL